MTTLLLAFFIGFFAELRALTAPAATAWAMHLGWLRLEGPLALISSPATPKWGPAWVES